MNVRHRPVGHHLHPLARAHRPEVAGLASEVRVDLGHAREAKASLEARHLAGLDLVEGVVTAHEQQPHRRAHHGTGVVRFVGGQYQ
jgi:hypothetical protein